MKSASKPRPIGQLLRNTQKGKDIPSSSLGKSSLLSIDEQIALLEKSVAASDESDDDDDGDSVSSGDVKVDRDEENHLLLEKDSHGNVLRIISSIDEDKIAPLPKEMLPGLKCSTSKKYSRSAQDDGPERQKRIRFNDNPSSSSSGPGRSRGLEATVKELLRNYEPAEKRPFYCRVCRHQATDLTEFEAHKLTEFHLKATEMERKVCYCRLCKKQFTSPDQLKEHLKGKSHTERMERAREYNENRKKFC